jgi:hypothetical protein
MVTTTNNAGVFDKRYIQALNEIAAKCMEEDPQINWINQNVVTPAHAPLYKKPIYEESIGIKGSHKLSLATSAMSTPQTTKEYNLEYVEADIAYDINDMLTEGQYLIQRKSQELRKFQTSVKEAIFKGVFTEGFVGDVGQGVRLNDGIIEQATLVQDLDGTNSQLTAAGDVYKALNKMLGSIPYRYRDGKQVFVGVDDLFVRNARRALYRGSTNQISEFDLFLNETQGDMAQQGNETRPRLIVSDKLFLNRRSGTTKTETDVVGTHSRIFMAIIDPEILEQVYSFYGIVGEETHGSIQSVDQKVAARCQGCVYRPEAVVYSEQITWA